MRHFWNWVKNEDATRTLYLEGVIAEESWFADDVTPAMFKEELYSGDGPITLHINSPGGDCIAASQIYTIYRATDRIKRIDRPGIRHTGHVDLAVIVAAVHLFQFFDVHFLIRDILEIHGDLAERMEEDKKIDRDDQFRSS